jgi:hypothetical protein
MTDKITNINKIDVVSNKDQSKNVSVANGTIEFTCIMKAFYKIQ